MDSEKTYKQGDYLDILDSTDQWCSAFVKKVNEDTGKIDVGFVHWGPRYD